jgi:Zn finger protein HypA/HybF involved in hydrogenase expression
MTLGGAARAGLRFVVWCKACSHQVEPDPAEQAQRYGAEATVIEWHARLSCSKCRSREVDMVVTGARRRPDS